MPAMAWFAICAMSLVRCAVCLSLSGGKTEQSDEIIAAMVTTLVLSGAGEPPISISASKTQAPRPLTDAVGVRI
ncbi:MAG: hypothetical protein ACI9U2_003571 [Bradymonadia bacterium]|jgi:hypothetical protein